MKINEKVKRGRGRPKLDPKDKKIKELKAVVVQHTKCLKEKDKRITQIENRWDTIKALFYGGELILLWIVAICGSVYAIMEYTDTFMWVMTGIGTLVTIFFIIFVPTSITIWFIGGEYTRSDLFASFLFAVAFTMIIGVFLSVILAQGGI